MDAINNYKNPNDVWDTMVTLKRWLENKLDLKSFESYFQQYGYKTIGFFDAGEIGKMFLKELQGTEIRIDWFVDNNAEGIGHIEGIPVYLMKDVLKLPKVDIVCVSPIFNYEAVNRYLVENNSHIRTLSLKDATFEI
ncbi:hypothetical protein [Oribacterium sp. FC2011]|uniref:hypothetical protein n=1 Tax=Oribacterium sp. FC2011 TaxID=1408311 RepID=UPI0004E12BE8|nr:hypothetical protein [Oribacterium sp. FC2011]